MDEKKLMRYVRMLLFAITFLAIIGIANLYFIEFKSTGRYVPFGYDNAFILDTQTGTVSAQTTFTEKK